LIKYDKERTVTWENDILSSGLSRQYRSSTFARGLLSYLSKFATFARTLIFSCLRNKMRQYVSKEE